MLVECPLLSEYVGGGSLSSKWHCSWSNTVGVGVGSIVPQRTQWYWFRKRCSGVGSATLVQEALS